MTVQTIYIQIVEGEGGRFHVRQRYTNGNILSTSPGYRTRWNAKRAAKRLSDLTGFEIKDFYAPGGEA